MRRRVVQFLVRMYPLAWRERYQFEFMGLLEDSEPDWRDVIDVARAVSREWASMIACRVFGNRESQVRRLRLRTLRGSLIYGALGVAIGISGEILQRRGLLIRGPSEVVIGGGVPLLITARVLLAGHRYSVRRWEFALWAPLGLAWALMGPKSHDSFWLQAMTLLPWFLWLGAFTKSRIDDREELRALHRERLREAAKRDFSLR